MVRPATLADFAGHDLHHTPAAHGRLHTLMLALALAPAAACVDSEPSGPTLASTSQLASVGSYTGGGGCSTAVVIGLSRQIADEVACLSPGALVKLPTTSGITLSSSAVLPYFEASAKTGLVAAAQEGSLQINSAFRTIAQQYLLYRWYVNGACGITAAATVGHSNHEGGRAVDLANYSSRVSIMSRHGWAHDVPGDPVHFDHTASADHRGLDTQAFQHLWNVNHPNDRIAEDGSYGPQTEARLKQAPATGFPIGASCAGAHLEASPVVAVDGPDRVAPGAQAHYAVTITNATDTAWPASTTLATADGAASPVYDPAVWQSATVFGTLGLEVPAGGQATLDLDVLAPVVTAETAINQSLVLKDDAGQVLGTVDLAFTVVPSADMTTPTTDGDDRHDEAPIETGGCSAGGAGGSGGLVLAALALIGVRRRRTRA